MEKDSNLWSRRFASIMSIISKYDVKSLVIISNRLATSVHRQTVLSSIQTADFSCRLNLLPSLWHIRPLVRCAVMKKGTVRSYWMGLHCIKQSWLVVTVWKSGFSKQFSKDNSSPKKRECYQHFQNANFVTCRSWPRTRSECGTPIGPGQKLKHWSRTTQLWSVKIVLFSFLQCWYKH